MPDNDWYERVTTALLMRGRELVFLVWGVLSVAGGIAMVLANPADNSTQGDEYGPDVPLQAWVVVVAMLLWVSGLFSVALFGIGLRQRARRRKWQRRCSR
jgi:hypothetical protein